MKKLFLLFALVIFVTASFGQKTEKPKPGVELNATKWSFNLAGGAADSLGLYQDSLSLPITFNLPDSVSEYYQTKITEVSSPVRIVVQVQAKRFSDDSWTTIFTKPYTGAGTDSTINISPVAAYKSWPYKRLLYVRTANKGYISTYKGYYKKQ